MYWVQSCVFVRTWSWLYVSSNLFHVRVLKLQSCVFMVFNLYGSSKVHKQQPVLSLRRLSLNILSLTLRIIFNSLTIKLCYNCTAPPHLCMPIICYLTRHKVSPALGSDSPLHPEANIGRYYLPLNRGKKLNNPRGCRVGDYEQPNYADNCVAVSPLRGVSDTDKCLSVAAQAASATFSERQRGATAEGDRVLLLLCSGWRQMSNNR